MKNLIAFFEIPAENFERAVKFYESVLNIQFDALCDCETEKMAFFPKENGLCPGHLSIPIHFIRQRLYTFILCGNCTPCNVGISS